MACTRPCRFCRRWFRADKRLKDRQYACPAPACQEERQVADRARWLARHPGYFRRRCEKHRAWRRAHPQANRLWRAAHPEARERQSRARVERRRRARLGVSAEQESMALHLFVPQRDAARHALSAEQEAIRAQAFVLAGVATRLPLSAEKEPIAGALTACHDRGRRLLGGGCPHALARPR